MLEKKPTQVQKVLNILKAGFKITQIDLKAYYELKKGNLNYISPYIDAIDMGIANLPARIWEIKEMKDENGKPLYKIKSEDVKTRNSHYAVYSMA